MRKLLVLMALCAFFLCGCAGRQMEEELLVIALAADREADGSVRLAVRAPAASQQQNDEMGYLTLEARGSALADAMMLLNASTPRKMNFSQVREILINGGAAQDTDLPAFLRQIALLPRMRAGAALIVCRESACEMARRLKPYMGLRLSRYADNSLSDAAGKGFTPAATLESVLRDLDSGLVSPLLILGAVNDFSGMDAPGASLAAAEAGSLPRKSADPIDLFGAAATDGHRVTGYLTGDEMALLHLLTGSGHFYAARLDEAPVTLHALGQAEKSVALRDGGAVLSLRLHCSYRASPGVPVDPLRLRRETEEALEKLMTRLQALGCDALGYGGLAARRFLRLRDWEALHFSRLYREAKWEIAVTLRRQAD